MLVASDSSAKVPSPGPATAPYSTGVHSSWRGGFAQEVKPQGVFVRQVKNLPSFLMFGRRWEEVGDIGLVILDHGGSQGSFGFESGMGERGIIGVSSVAVL